MNLKTWYSGNTYMVLLFRLIMVLVLLFISRLLIYFFNVSLFPELSFRHLLFISFVGLRFDLFTLMVVNLPFVFFNAIPIKFKYSKIYQRINDLLFYILNSLALTANFIDVIYFRFTQKRMTFDIFEFINKNNEEIVSLIPDFIRDFWFPFVLWIVFLVLLIWISQFIKVDNSKLYRYKFVNYLIDTFKFIIVAVLVIIAGRGGVQYKPLNIVNAGEYTEPRYFPLILNTPFTILKTKDEFGIAEKTYFNNEQELEKIFSPVRTGRNLSEGFKRLNVVIIILESFTTEHSAYLNPKLENGRYTGYTPFLDSLMKYSLVFRGYANGEKSIDGIPAIISGIPSLMNSPYLLSPYVSNNIYSIAGLLKEKGYSTAFYHGGTNGTMGFESYTKIAGFDKYYGKTEYNNDEDFDGRWGIFDEEFLQFTADKLNRTQEPFISVIFTLSSHHPYTIPEKYEGKFRKGNLEIHESIMYADYSLEKFFETVSQMPWFENTLFVLTADHTSEGYFPFYRTAVGRYSIPIIFYQYGKTRNKISEKTAQQADITPSILNYLNYMDDYLAFGQSVFDSSVSRFAVSHLNGIFQLIQDGYVYQFDGEKDISLYYFKNDSLLRRNLINEKDSVRHEMNTLTKAIIQQFNNRMIHNKLTMKKQDL